jgi:tetratricopeptide (TPR) repeat protein
MNARYRRLLAIAYQNEGDYGAMLGDNNGALESFRKKLALDERAVAQDPANTQSRSDLGYTCKRIGDLLIATAKYSQALMFDQKALEMWEPLVDKSLKNLGLMYSISKTHAGLCLIQAKLGDRSSALTRCGQALSQLDKIEDDPTNTALRTARAEAFSDIASANVALATAAHTSNESVKYWHGAREMYQRSFDIFVDLRRRGIITGVDASKPEEIQREVVKCDAALRSK